MILGSHNSWSFLPPVKWWQRALAFTARCQRLNIKEQYEAGVRCFDLRIRIIGSRFHIVHGKFDYGLMRDYTQDFAWLHSMCKYGDVYIRVIHDVRTYKEYKDADHIGFAKLCKLFEEIFPDFKLWCGRNLYNYGVEYDFSCKPECTEMYASVCSPRLIDDWFPLIYAKRNNAWIRREEYKEDEILLIDFVDIK